MLGGTKQHVIDAVSNAWIDGGALRAYRHAPNTGTRKELGAGRCREPRRAPRADLVAGEMGYPSALSRRTWGFYDVRFEGKAVPLPGLRSYVMENVLFKIAFPRVPRTDGGGVRDAAAPEVKIACGHRPRGDRDAGAGLRIIDKTGPLANPADRDHCLQYMTAIPLIFGRSRGRLRGRLAGDPRVTPARRMLVRENVAFTEAY